MSEHVCLFGGIEVDMQHVIIKKLRKGQIIVDYIDGEEYVGIVQVGEIDVYSVALDGKTVKLTTLVSEDVFGICNLFYQSDLTTVLKAKEKSIVYMIPKTYVRACVMKDEAILNQYLNLCNRKIQFLIHRIEELTMQSPRNRLLDYLTAHCETDGRVRLQCTREELAGHLGISRATLFREIAALKKENYITTKSVHIYINQNGGMR